MKQAEALYYDIVLNYIYYHHRHMTDSIQAVVLVSSRKPPCSNTNATGLEQCSTVVLVECKEKESVEKPQDETKTVV